MSNAKNAGYTKEYNRLQILRYLRQQPASRAELARRTGLTRAAISLITEELMASGFIKESGQSIDHGRGRTPVLLKLHPDGAYAVGICLTRQDCRVGLCDFRGRLLGSRSMPLPKRAQELAAVVGSAVETLVEENSVCKEKILGAGVVTPGPVDAQSGIILNPPGFSAFHGFAICESLRQRLGLPVLLENDANASALHNYMDGQFPGKENFLLLLVDSGVGSGAIMDGKLLRRCELGHTSIDYRGPKCACGNRGCLETFAATPRIMKAFPGYDSWESLMKSEEGDGALKLEAKYLASAIVNFTNLLPAQTVLLTGQLRDHAERLAPMIQAELCGKALLLDKGAITILPALHTPEEGVQASCSVVIGRYLGIC
jgi:predicted NBD/HSP70 family sugar kinase